MELRKKLSADFFKKNTILVAKNLLGKYLCRRLRSERVICSRITETEAYRGFNDRASHASRGRTKRTEVMFGLPGTIYIYFIYGVHYCLNLVCEKKDFPAAVLIRSVEGARGPGRVCRYFKIDRNLNGKKLSRELWIEDRGLKITKKQFRAVPRVGVDYAGASRHLPWRFVLK